ncbi:MAG: hypothetical protein P1U85_20760 [Verrucomicrobiales bacterium]|nr:hypothetical protein [Verrucomicrobiales bacterium]
MPSPHGHRITNDQNLCWAHSVEIVQTLLQGGQLICLLVEFHADTLHMLHGPGDPYTLPRVEVILPQLSL